MKSLLLIFIIAISSITNVQALQELSKSEKKKYAHIPMQVIDSSEAKKNVGLGVFFKECFHDDKIMVKKTSRSFDGGCLLINGTKENISKMKTKLNRAAIKHCESYNRKAYYRGNGEFIF